MLKVITHCRLLEVPLGGCRAKGPREALLDRFSWQLGHHTKQPSPLLREGRGGRVEKVS